MQLKNTMASIVTKPAFKEEWKSGLFVELFDGLLGVLPLVECGAVHVDNFQCYHNYKPDITIEETQRYRKKMIEYVHQKGIDITSEFTYKEDEKLPNKKLFGLSREHNPHAPMDTLGLIPASWWCTKMTREEYVLIPPTLYGGGRYKDGRYDNYLYGNMQGEDVWLKHYQNGNWEEVFLYQFATIQIPHQFLCQFKRKAIVGKGRNEMCIF